MRKAQKGDRVKVTCQGVTVTGKVETADHEYKYTQGQPPEVVGYLLEIRGDDGLPYYWKSLYDGGSIEFLDPDYLSLLAEYARGHSLTLTIDKEAIRLRDAEGNLVAAANVPLFGLAQAAGVCWAEITEDEYPPEYDAYTRELLRDLGYETDEEQDAAQAGIASNPPPYPIQDFAERVGWWEFCRHLQDQNFSPGDTFVLNGIVFEVIHPHTDPDFPYELLN